jgi:hypothetical protein
MNPTSLLVDSITRTIRSIKNPRGSCFVGARAQGDVVAQISDAPGHSDDPLARGLGFVAGPVGRSADIVEFVAGARSRRRFRIAP